MNVKHNYLPFTLFIIMILLMCIIEIDLYFNAEIEDSYEKIESIIPIFYDENNNIIENTLDLYEIGETGRIYFIVPENLIENTSLCFRSRHLYFSVYYNDKLLYKSTYDEDVKYTNSTGVDWIVIPLSTSYKGQKIYIDYKLAYNKSDAGFDRAVIMRSDEFVLDVISEKLSPVFLCIVYVTVGVILVILGGITFKLSKGNSSLFWLGAFSLSVALYCFIETQFFQLFIDNSRLIHLSVMFALFSIPIPAATYINSLLEIKSKKIISIFSSIVFVSFLIMSSCNSLEIIDYHECLLLIQGYIVIAVSLMTIGIIVYVVSQIRKEKKLSFYNMLLIIGVLGVMVTGTIDIFKYWFDSTDPASTVRYGFLIFIVSLAISSSERVITAFQTSSKAKIIAKLAYEDGLTGLLNRTSYQEMLQNIENNIINTGIIMMDLNNLKQVNDTFGHDDGDEMILYSANIIVDAFKNIAGNSCYRIGGDEFVVLIQNDNIEQSCKDGITKLQNLYNEFNMTTNKNFKIVIAVGYSIYDNTRELKDIIEEADSIMYINKRKLKGEKEIKLLEEIYEDNSEINEIFKLSNI